jgi:hypothetical protein
MKQSRINPTFHASTRLKIPHRVLVTRVLGEYRPEAASLSAAVFDALQSTVDSLVNEGGHGCTRYSTLLTSFLEGKADDTALVPLVFVAHLVEELSSNSPFITNIGCEQSIAEGTSSHTSPKCRLIARRFPEENSRSTR